MPDLNSGSGPTDPVTRAQVAIFTGGGDRPYAIGLASSLLSAGVRFDFIGSDDLETPALRDDARVRFLNLRGDQAPNASLINKISRITKYYLRLLRYAAIAEPAIFHILWNNKLELVDRTLLALYYRLLRKRIVLTVHNVNMAKRDGNDGLINRLTLWVQYRLADHLFVHTPQMKAELTDEFGVPATKVSVIPFGLNSTVPDTALTSSMARKRLGLDEAAKTVLFFGNIAPYKGLEYLVEAIGMVGRSLPDCHLIIAGRPKGSEAYWPSIERRIEDLGLGSKVTRQIGYVPDVDTETYFKAADVLVLPYTHVFQSGVLSLAYNFGLPVIATNVGSLKDDIVEGMTGFVCEPRDPESIAKTLEHHFASPLYSELDARRSEIRRFASERYSWTTVAAITTSIYGATLARTTSRSHAHCSGAC
jgi:glycosyltransferase involved in cell wall biosynthesis